MTWHRCEGGEGRRRGVDAREERAGGERAGGGPVATGTAVSLEL
jgi:hypothetical protein